MAGVTAELAVVVGAPTEHLTFGGDGARVPISGVKVNHGRPIRKVDASGRIHIEGAGRGGRGVAHLLLIVGTPADNRRL